MDRLEYYGYPLLNKPVLFRGGLPPLETFIAIMLSIFTSVILMGAVHPIFGLVVSVIVIGVLIKIGTKVAINNRQGDRDFLKSQMAFGRSPKQLRDEGFFKSILEHE
jgi:uncharacterized protein YacL